MQRAGRTREPSTVSVPTVDATCCTPAQANHSEVATIQERGDAGLVFIPIALFLITFVRLVGEANDAVNSLRTKMRNRRGPGLEY